LRDLTPVAVICGEWIPGNCIDRGLDLVRAGFLASKAGSRLERHAAAVVVDRVRVVGARARDDVLRFLASTSVSGRGVVHDGSNGLLVPEAAR
jgi:hypothetical protein